MCARVHSCVLSKFVGEFVGVNLVGAMPVSSGVRDRSCEQVCGWVSCEQVRERVLLVWVWKDERSQ